MLQTATYVTNDVCSLHTCLTAAAAAFSSAATLFALPGIPALPGESPHSAWGSCLQLGALMHWFLLTRFSSWRQGCAPSVVIPPFTSGLTAAEGQTDGARRNGELPCLPHLQIWKWVSVASKGLTFSRPLSLGS